jgi:hypothetical protein
MHAFIDLPAHQRQPKLRKTKASAGRSKVGEKKKRNKNDALQFIYE